MPIMVIRHATALARSDWDGDDAARPLSIRGVEQARLLVPLLEELKPRRLLSSPARRCIETVAPLAEAVGLDVEQDQRLAEGAGTASLVLARQCGEAGGSAALCSHGDVIPELLAALAEEDGIDLGPYPKVQKASVWLLHGDGGRFHSASYLEPPGTD